MSGTSPDNVIVTGGAGFIGSHLVDALLAQGCRVTVLDDLSTGRVENLAHVDTEDVTLVEADIAEYDAIAPLFAGVDHVYHLAALADIVPSIVHPLTYHRANVVGTANVVEAARRAGVSRLVYTASYSCYGFPEVYPTPETAAIDPQYPYAFSKWAGEQTALHWAKVYDLPVVSLRLANVYGPRSRTSGTYGAVFGVFLAQKLAGEPFTVVGDGTQTRDFVYVTDVARAFVAAARSDVHGEVINVGSGAPQSVNRLVELLGGDVVHVPKRPGEPDRTWADISKAGRLLGWAPATDFTEGVASMVEAIDYWRDAPVWTPETIDEATTDWFKYLGAPADES